MDASAKHAHANNGWTLCSEGVIFEVEESTWIDERFTKFCGHFLSRFFSPCLVSIQDVVNDAATEESDLGVIIV